MKQSLLFVITQFFKGGAEVSLLNLLKQLNPCFYDIDLMIINQDTSISGVSLIPFLPDHIHVMDVFFDEKKHSIKNRIKGKLLYTDIDKETMPVAAYEFVRKKEYDWAFHIGEWSNPNFVADQVRAKRKVCWIHSDISVAPYFNEEEYFKNHDQIDKYFFVSEHSLASSVEKYPFIQKKAEVIFNICDVDGIKKKAEETIDEPSIIPGVPVVLTCANIRTEKNHMRQLEAMRILKEHGKDFIWLNIGSTANTQLVNELKLKAKAYGLADRFLLLGSRDNPYPYIKRADVVTVLSDFESWSMVITEAKILGTPVVATKTSGATEQIENMKTGILTEFNAVDIAEKLEQILTDPKLYQSIKKNIQSFDNTDEIIQKLDNILRAPDKTEQTKGLLYIIDDINYPGGAHVATKNLINELEKEGKQVTVFSTSKPSIRIRNQMPDVRFISWESNANNQLYWRRCLECLIDKNLSREAKKIKIRMTLHSKTGGNVFNEYVIPAFTNVFSEYDVVCVMSEASAWREKVAVSSAKRKVQYIHTDYTAWKQLSDWTKATTEDDERIYQNFDRIVLLSNAIKDRFCALYPSLADKTVVNQNVMPISEIMKKATLPEPKGEFVRFVTVGRIDRYKGYDRIYNALKKLKEENYQFHWTIIGSGDELDHYKQMFAQSAFSKDVDFLGALDNPFIEIKKADVFTLLSRYEGLPNTIYEALILGVPVLATNVGGISSQVKPGENGWLIQDDERSIYEGIKYILENADEIRKFKKNLEHFEYNNTDVINITKEILFG